LPIIPQNILQVCLKASGAPPYTASKDGGVRVVCVLNYNRLGLVAEVRK
jgi:hypothetical protein